MRVRGFITHKQAEHYADCQDFFSINVEKKRIAVSDGMTQSIFSARWAQNLVHAYVNDGWDGLSNLSEQQNKWLDFAKQELRKLEEQGLPTWMLENSLTMRLGAGATLCGVCFEGFKWSGFVLGDTSIVEIDSDNHITDIYKSKPGSYDNHPDYYDSFGAIVGEPLYPSRLLEESHKLFLVSDPFAEILYNINGEKCAQDYVRELLAVSNHEEFVQLVDRWRMEKSMHNDDSTLIIIENDGSELFNIDKMPPDNLDKLIENETKETEL